MEKYQTKKKRELPNKVGGRRKNNSKGPTGKAEGSCMVESHAPLIADKERKLQSSAPTPIDFLFYPA